MGGKGGGEREEKTRESYSHHNEPIGCTSLLGNKKYLRSMQHTCCKFVTISQCECEGVLEVHATYLQ